MFGHKVIPFDQASAFFQKIRDSSKRIVQCHGTFDLVHPGLIPLLESARSRGDVLVVTLVADPSADAMAGRPYFGQDLRAKHVSSLQLVDHVVVVPGPSALEAIRCVRPDVYCIAGDGNPPPDSDALDDTLSLLASLGGEAVHLESPGHSSQELTRHFFNQLPERIRVQCQSLANQYSPERFQAMLDQFSNLRVLIIGDTIFDRYSYVKVQGLTSKNRILSGRFLDEHTDPGGALAVARHISQFTPHIRMVSVVGTEPWVDHAVRAHLSEDQDLFVRDSRITTILKQRYVEPVSEGKEMNKLFSVNYIDAGPPPEDVTARVLENVSQAMPVADLVVVTDFGHGIMAPAVREFVQKNARFLALNCQTNSYNHGFNIISNQYQRCDCFSLDEQEMLLSCARRGINHQEELEALRAQMGARYAWLTRGGVETLGIDDRQNAHRWPPLEPTVTDTVGAGDAFFSVVALAAASQLPVDLSTFLGQLAGGQAVKIVGNSEPISKNALLKSGLALLNC